MKKYLHSQPAKTTLLHNPLFISLIILAFALCLNLKTSAQCAADSGTLAGSGSFCDGDQIDIGIPATKKSQTYTWYQNGTNIVKGPVSGNGDAISYNAFMSPSSAGHYTVVTAKDGCTSTEFGDVNIVYVGAVKKLSIINVSYDSVKFKWKAIDGVLGYEYAVDNDPSSPSSGTFTFNNFATVNNLTPFITYYIHVRASSGNGGECTWTTLKFTSSPTAGDGTLDTSFNKTGKASIKIGSFCEANTQIIQPNGRIIIAGTSYNNGYDFAMTRYNQNGTIDRSFGNKGKVTTDINGNDFINAIALQSNGKIVVAGISLNTSESEFELVRYGIKGDIDSSFGTNGKVFTDIMPGHNDVAQAIAIQTDGKIVVAGYADNGTTNDIILVRYNSNGSLDNSFGNGGKVITDFGGDEFINGMTLQPDGKIVVVGSTNSNGSSDDFLIARYNTNGVLNNTFGYGGKNIIDFGGNNDYAYSAIVISKGKIIVCGSSYIPSTTNSSVALVRFNQNGLVDKSFDGDGLVSYTDFNNQFLGRQVFFTADKKILVAGTVYNNFNNDAMLLRFSPPGTVDSSFGYNGVIFTDINTYNDVVYGAGIQSDGKVVVSGTTTDASNNEKFFIVRYNYDTSASAFAPVARNNEKIISAPSSKIILSPNPVKNILTVSGMQSEGIKNIFIIDVTGRTLQALTTSSSSYSFNVNRLPAGLYYISIEENKKLSYLKFIKE